MSHTHSTALASSSIVAILILTALIYLRGWMRVGRRGGEAIATWRVASFLGGLFFIGLALASPIAALDHELLTAHMVQHLLLMTLAPALTLLGAPLLPLLHGLPQMGVGRAAISGFWWAPAARLGRLLAQPASCWIAATATLVGWHIPALFTVGFRSEFWHGVEHASF